MLALRRKRGGASVPWGRMCSSLWEMFAPLWEDGERERWGGCACSSLWELLAHQERRLEDVRGNGGQDRVGAPSLSFSLFAAPPIPPRWQKELARSSGKRHNWLGIEPRSTYFCRLRVGRDLLQKSTESCKDVSIWIAAASVLTTNCFVPLPCQHLHTPPKSMAQ